MITQKMIDYLTLFGIILISIDLASFFLSTGSNSPIDYLYGMYTIPLGIIGIILLVSSYVLSRRQVKDGDSKAMDSKTAVKSHLHEA